MVTERAQEKRRRMLEAARLVVLRDGLRGATMEAIAREAGIAKATLYAQFSDKDAVVGALVETMLDALMEAFEAGMASDGDAAERIGDGLARQYLALARMLEGSPHATEIMSAHKRLGLSLQDRDIAMVNRIEAVLADAGVADPDALTHLVMAASYGIAFKTRDEVAMAAGIRLLCRRLIEPETASA